MFPRRVKYHSILIPYPILPRCPTLLSLSHATSNLTTLSNVTSVHFFMHIGIPPHCYHYITLHLSPFPLSPLFNRLMVLLVN
ncbi:hypothetical protein PILCRDRAFT_812620, partial [Piloderma croceum F 1598]